MSKLMKETNKSNSQAVNWKIEMSSGFLAGFVSVTICAPLDIIRTRLNIQYSTKSGGKYKGFLDTFRKMKAEEGFLGFYKGYKATAITYPIFHSMYFSIYNYVKPRAQQKFNGKYSQYIIASCVSGFICDVITNPLWLARTRMQVQYLHDSSCKKYNGVIQTLNSIYKEEGFGALFKGLGASLLGLTHVAIYFPIYEILKLKIQDMKQDKNLTSKDILVASIVSKLSSCISTYPHIVIRTRLFDNRANYSGQKRIRIHTIIKQLYSERGIYAFYSGLKVDLIRVLPANTITFIVYEATKKYLLQKQQEKLI